MLTDRSLNNSCEYFAEEIFKCIAINKYDYIVIKISQGLICNKSTLHYVKALLYCLLWYHKLND